MRIRDFDFSDADYATLARIFEAACPGQPESPEYWRRVDGERDPALLQRRLIGEVAGEPVAVATYGHDAMALHPRKLLIDLRVAPEHQGRGYGARLYDHLRQEAASVAPISFEAMTRDDLPRAVRFLEDRGFELRQRQASSELDLAAFDPAPYRPLRERLARRGFALRTWRQLADEPGAEQRLYELSHDIYPDVPWHTDGSPIAFDFWIQSYRDNPDLLPDCLVVAIDEASDRWVALSQIWASQASRTLFFTGLTGVLREARRQGLATAVKVETLRNLAAAQPAHPRGPFVRTQNYEHNPMLTINRRLGFTELPAGLAYVLEVEEES
ncbi:MAG: GNAT family N-acetyltransferase [Acidobacteriota bacterium]